MKIVGNVYLVVLLGIVYNIVIVSIGFLVSLYARNSLQVTRYIMLLSTPFFLISGYTWPSMDIPVWIKAIAGATPFAWMADSFRKVTVKNLGFGYIRGNITVLCIMAVMAVVLCISFSKTRKPGKEGEGAA